MILLCHQTRMPRRLVVPPTSQRQFVRLALAFSESKGIFADRVERQRVRPVAVTERPRLCNALTRMNQAGRLFAILLDRSEDLEASELRTARP